MKKCSVTSCERKIHGKSLCSMHYKRFLKHGSTDKFVYVPKSRGCDHRGCKNKHDSHGFCANHARQFKKYGRIRTKEELSTEISNRHRGNKYNLGKKWQISLEKREKMKGVCRNTGRTHFTKGQSPWNDGVIGWLSSVHKEAISRANTGRTPWNKDKRMESIQGEKNWIWAGDNVSYRALHRWVERYLGKPGTCEHCKKKNLTEHQIHWSNISGDYLRDLDDWQRLCAKCHKAYDKQLKLARTRG